MDDNENSATETAHRKTPWTLIILVIVATTLAVWLVPDNSRNEESLTTETPAATKGAPSLLAKPVATAAATEETPAVAAAAAEHGKAPVPVDNTPGAQARLLIQTLRSQARPDYAEAYAEANKQLAAGRDDDAYLLYFFAAREGHGESAMALATQSDPAFFDSDKSVFDAADSIQAHKWYKLALESGIAGAEQRLQQLHANMEQAASTGDSLAQRALLQWK